MLSTVYLHLFFLPLTLKKKREEEMSLCVRGQTDSRSLLLGRRVVGVESLIRRREGAITWPAHLRRRNRAFPRERARRSPRVLGCLASLVCTQSAADYGPLLAARVFSQSRLICTDFSGELLEFWGVALKEEPKISNHLVRVSSGRQDVFVLTQKTRRLQVIFVMSGEWGLFMRRVCPDCNQEASLKHTDMHKHTKKEIKVKLKVLFFLFF